jgi:hypothetical protein
LPTYHVIVGLLLLLLLGSGLGLFNGGGRRGLAGSGSSGGKRVRVGEVLLKLNKGNPIESISAQFVQTPNSTE